MGRKIDLATWDRYGEMWIAQVRDAFKVWWGREPTSCELAKALSGVMGGTLTLGAATLDITERGRVAGPHLSQSLPLPFDDPPMPSAIPPAAEADVAPECEASRKPRKSDSFLKQFFGTDLQ